MLIEYDVDNIIHKLCREVDRVKEPATLAKYVSKLSDDELIEFMVEWKKCDEQ